MIQRIQTVFLALAFIALALLFLLPIAEFSSTKLSLGDSLIHVPVAASGSTLDYKIYAFEETADLPATPQKPDYSEFYLINTLVIIAGMLLLLVCIFLYKNRKQQLLFCWSAVIAMIICAVLIYIKIKPEEAMLQGKVLGTGSFALTGALILTVLASRGIRSDEALVRSADRLR